MLHEEDASDPAVVYQHNSFCTYPNPFFQAHPAMFPVTVGGRTLSTSKKSPAVLLK